MPALHIRNIPDDIHQGLKALANSHGRSTEAEVREILALAVKPVRMGEALWALGREIGLTDESIQTINDSRDRAPATPMSFDE